MTVVMFPGQGSQKIDMGKNLFPNYQEIVSNADEILGESLVEICLDSDKLSNTKYTQSALFCVNYLSYLEFRKTNDAPNYFIGHSLGEYNALVAAGAMDFKTGLTLVKERGRLMSEVENGAMSAIIGLSLDKVESILDSCNSVDLANINAPNQVVISGSVDDIGQVEATCKESGAKLTIRLIVSGAFHSRYMEDVAKTYQNFIAKIEFLDMQQPVIRNVTGTPHELDNIGDYLVQQIFSSVQWVKSVQYIERHGETEFIEVGPGRVLTGLLRHIRSVK